ncbi:ribose-5-phosphate isomerase RpiA [uncultured Sphingomonas sp.]|uniref:ribose-5-phosphate isomerase RpiA n=1 Tax=uncultured Sphingomonas sp. TaxID=158754 RepID=UPI0025E1C405|nr:ribose-5-phosphate isomerase RpiA [uncultured Sphingomonas sp.]
MSQNEDKRLAALAAADEVRDGMLVGLGTGSTAAFLIDELARRARDGLRIEAVATSLASDAQAKAGGLTVRPFEDVAAIDLCIDGADEIDGACRAIKGAGAAMVREKIVATAATRMVVIADGCKKVAQLGAAPVPVEVLPFGRAFVARALAELGGKSTLRPRGDAPYLTDQGNLILDTHFGLIADPATLARHLSLVPGVVGHGLFIDEVDALYLAEGGTVTRIERSAAI